MSDLWWLAAAAAAVAVVAYIARKLRPSRPAAARGAPVHFTRHARERMAQRGITPDQVRLLLAHPERRKSDPTENSVRLERDFPGRTLRVWVAQPWPDTQEIVVKTTAWRYTTTIKVPVERVGRIIGRGGATIKQIQTATGTRIAVDRKNGTVAIRSGERTGIDQARKRIEALSS